MPQATGLFCRLQLDLEVMGSIDTEDAARRLARVILSDIDLYMRERPRQGESREAQIEEGRRLFASRVTPALVPVFGMVLADRAAGRVNAPAAAPAPSIPAVVAAATVAPVHSPPAVSSEFDDAPATDPSIFVPPVEDQPPPPPTPPVRPAPPAPPPPRVVARPRPENPVRPPPPPPAAARAPAPVAQARPVAPPAPEIPAPVSPALVPPARVSIPRLLAIAGAVAAIVALFRLVFR